MIDNIWDIFDHLGISATLGFIAWFVFFKLFSYKWRKEKRNKPNPGYYSNKPTDVPPLERKVVNLSEAPKETDNSADAQNRRPYLNPIARALSILNQNESKNTAVSGNSSGDDKYDVPCPLIVRKPPADQIPDNKWSRYRKNKANKLYYIFPVFARHIKRIILRLKGGVNHNA